MLTRLLPGEILISAQCIGFHDQSPNGMEPRSVRVYGSPPSIRGNRAGQPCHPQARCVVLSKELVIRAFIMGVVATALFDAWGQALWRFRGIRPPVWARLGRLLLRGRAAILGHGPPVPPFSQTERMLGSVIHYATGIVFALVLLWFAGAPWAREPRLLPALVAGVLTLVPAWLVMLPVLGLGVAGQRLPQPNRFRLVNTVSHLVLGLGFYIGALASNVL